MTQGDLGTAGLTHAANSYRMAMKVTVKVRDRNKKARVARLVAQGVLKELHDLAHAPIELSHGLALGGDDVALVEAHEATEKMYQEVLRALKELESRDRKEEFERFLAQYTPDLLPSYQHAIIAAVARAREIAASAAFIIGEDYRQFGFAEAIPPAAPPGTLQGPAVDAEYLFR